MSNSVSSIPGEAMNEGTEEQETDEDESGPAEDFGIKVGVPIGFVSLYLLFASPYRMISFASKSGDLFAYDSSNEPLFYIGVTTLVVALFGGLLYPLVGEELYEDYKRELAIGTIFPPAGVILFLFTLVVLEPTLNAFLVGEFATGVGYFVATVIGLAILIGSSIGILAAVVFFGMYLGLPSYVGTYAGSFVGEFVSNDSR